MRPGLADRTEYSTAGWPGNVAPLPPRISNGCVPARATAGNRNTAMPLSSVTAEASRVMPSEVVPRKASVVRRSGVRARLRRTRTLAAGPAVVMTFAGWGPAGPGRTVPLLGGRAGELLARRP